MSSSFIKSKGGKAWLIVTCVVLALAIAVNYLALTMFRDMANLVFGSPKPIYADDGASASSAKTASIWPTAAADPAASWWTRARPCITG